MYTKKRDARAKLFFDALVAVAVAVAVAVPVAVVDALAP